MSDTTQFTGVVAHIEMNVRVMVHHVIDPMVVDLPLTRRAKVVVEGFQYSGGKGRASPVKIPQRFFLCRVGSKSPHRQTPRTHTATARYFAWALRSGWCPIDFFFAARASAQSRFLNARRIVRRLAGVPSANSRRDSSPSDRLVHSTPARIGSPAVNSWNS